MRHQWGSLMFCLSLTQYHTIVWFKQNLLYLHFDNKKQNSMESQSHFIFHINTISATCPWHYRVWCVDDIFKCFFWMKIIEFLFKFHWKLIAMVQLAISQQWFRQWFVAKPLSELILTHICIITRPRWVNQLRLLLHLALRCGLRWLRWINNSLSPDTMIKILSYNDQNFVDNLHMQVTKLI